MKQVSIILIAICCLGIGYEVGQQNSSSSDLVELQESRFVIYNQQARYKLSALKYISEGKPTNAVGILRASLIVDESEMSYCGAKTSACDSRFKQAFQEYMVRKTNYETNTEEK